LKYNFILAFFIIVVAIPVIAGVGSDMFKRWLKHRERMADALTAETAERAAQYAAKTERLEQRVAVLERLLTDRSTRLADEIDRLRDEPLN
jgi:LytS/YehU family sensor histidine kinase